MKNDEITLANQISIREAGLDELWLQNQIYENPAVLGLGELEAIDRERKQSSGGRLDILLKNPEDDSMYEVEVMLGETDETHIIRTLEYWDIEKRKWPQRQHFAVLVAEHINRRFFNVIHLLSNSVPIIAIQASLLDLGTSRTLFFSKVLDTYEEIDDGSSIESKDYTREYWIKKSKWTTDTADALLEMVKTHFQEPKLNYLKNYIAVSVSGYNYFTLRKRSANKTLVHFPMSPIFDDEVGALLDEQKIPFTRKPKKIAITIDKDFLGANIQLVDALAKLIVKSQGSA